MEVIVWIAFAVIVHSGGSAIINDDTPNRTLAACEEKNKEAAIALRAHPQASEILAIGFGCAEVKVKPVVTERKPAASKTDEIIRLPKGTLLQT